MKNKELLFIVMSVMVITFISKNTFLVYLLKRFTNIVKRTMGRLKTVKIACYSYNIRSLFNSINL